MAGQVTYHLLAQAGAAGAPWAITTIVSCIQRLARRLGDQLVAGVVLYADGQPLPFGDQLRAGPISALWALAPDAGSE